VWDGPAIDQRLSLEEVQRLTSRIELEARPLMKKTGPWSTLTAKAHKTLENVIGASAYRAFEGLNTALNATYWVRIQDKLPDGSVLVKNVTEGAKREVREVEAPVEKELVYPLLRGRDVERWKASSKIYIILPTDSRGNTLQITSLKVNYPRTYKYFNEFFDQLITRSGEPYKSQLKPWREKARDVAERIAPPFYMVFNAYPSLAPYKVVWREQAGGLTVAVVGLLEDNYLGRRIVIPDHKLMLVPSSSEEEAHFICAILNSSIARLIAKSYIVETQISTHVLEYVKVPKFDPTNPLHLRLAQLSKEAHELASRNAEEELTEIENEIDNIVAQLYNITNEELKEIKRNLAILEGREIEEEEEEEQIPQANPEIFIETPVFYEGDEQELVLNVINHYDKPIKDVKVKLVLEGKSFEEVFDEITDETRATFCLGGLRAGEYQVTLSMEYLWEGSLKKVEKVVPIYVKRSSESKVKRSSLDELLG